MPVYRAYALDSQRHIVGRFDFEAEDDASALMRAREYVNACEIEVWNRDRMIAKHAREPQ